LVARKRQRGIHRLAIDACVDGLASDLRAGRQTERFDPQAAPSKETASTPTARAATSRDWVDSWVGFQGYHEMPMLLATASV
jgi:hypothetical protein